MTVLAAATPSPSAQRAPAEIQAEIDALGEEYEGSLAVAELQGLFSANTDVIHELEDKIVAGEQGLEKTLAKAKTRNDELTMKIDVANRKIDRARPDWTARRVGLLTELAEAQRREQAEEVLRRLAEDRGALEGNDGMRIQGAADLSQLDAEHRRLLSKFRETCEWAQTVDGVARAWPFVDIPLAPEREIFARVADVARALGLRIRFDSERDAFVVEPTART